jgi:putative transposase
MNKKFKNKYRIPSSRLPNWDYSQSAKYHITICTHLMQHFFGRIEYEEMIYSPEGAIVLETLTNLPKKFEFLQIDEFQIMPNHIHMIILIADKADRMIDKHQNPQSSSGSEFTSIPKFVTCEGHINPFTQSQNAKEEERDMDEQASADLIPFLNKFDDIPDFEKIHQKSGGITGKHNPMLNENLSTVLRFFKGKSTFLIHKINKSFDWHPRFYDTIIRHQDHLQKTRKYIRNNCKKWGNKKWDK